ncbi:cell division protein PerM [Flexivirga sp. B27]
MSLLDRVRTNLPSALASSDEPRDWRQLSIAAGYGSVGAVTLGLVLILPVMVAWAADAQSTATWTDALSFAGDGWALAHRGHVSVAAGATHSVTFAPLVLTGLAVLFARMGAKAMLTHLSGRGGAWWEGPAAYIGGYVATGLVICGLALSGPAHPNLLTVLPGALVVGFAGCTWALLRSDEPVAEQAKTMLDQRISLSTRRALRPAAEAVLGYLAVGLVIVLLLVLTHAAQIGDLNGQLEPGILGGVVLWVGQLAALPNLLLWSAGWTTGAAMQIGAVSVGSTSVHGGLLPMIPVLGAVPDAGALPTGTVIAPLIPVALGAFVGYRSLANLTTYASLKTKATTAAQAVGMTVAIVLLLTWLSTAGVSGGSLDYIGPSLLLVPLLVVELLLGALVATLFLHWKRALRR